MKKHENQLDRPLSSKVVKVNLGNFTQSILNNALSNQEASNSKNASQATKGSCNKSEASSTKPPSYKKIRKQ